MKQSERNSTHQGMTELDVASIALVSGGIRPIDLKVDSLLVGLQGVGSATGGNGLAP